MTLRGADDIRRLLGLLFVGVVIAGCGSSSNFAGRCLPSNSSHRECNYVTVPPEVPRPTPPTTSPPATTAPGYTLTATPTTQEVKHGGSTTYTVTVEPNSSFDERVTLSVSGLPAGATGGFEPVEVGSWQSSTLTVASSRGASRAGNYPLTISGDTPNGRSRDVTVTLVVTK